jgi:cobalt-zinc-cadmium efflux system membrane fusion protein
MKTKIIIPMNNKILILALAIFLTFGCKQNKEIVENEVSEPELSQVVELTDAQYQNARLEISVPEKRNIAHIIYLNGKTEVMPENNISVSSPVNGFIRQIKWIPGMNVSKGQTLVKLEEKEYIQWQQDYLSAKNAWQFAKLDYERQSELSRNQAVSEKVLQQADEKVRDYHILMKSLGEKLKLIHINPATLNADNMISQIVISAPVSGTITDVMVNTGQYVHAGDPMVSIIDHHGKKIVLKAFEKDLPYLKTGQKIVAYSNSETHKKMEGKIDFIVKNIEEQGFTKVICSVDGHSSDMVPGTYMNAEIEARSTEAWTVPEEAIVQFEGKEYIFAERGKNSFEMLEIQPGAHEEGRVEIIYFPGIEERQIVVQGAYTLLMKMKNVEE